MSKLLGQLFRPFNIFVLCGLVATAQQNNDHITVSLVVYPVSRALIDPQFVHTLADGFCISGIAQRQAPNANFNAGNSFVVSEFVQPIRKDCCFPDFEHVCNLVHRPQKSMLRPFALANLCGQG
jgi:hypothetical protein